MNKKNLKKMSSALKNKAASLAKKTEAALKNKGGLSLLAMMLIVVCAATAAPFAHKAFIRSKVGSRVYMVRTSPTGGGGTGFMVKAPSGKSYLMTNDHVCAASKNGEDMVVMTDSGDWIPRRILHRSDKTDLCLLDGMPGVEGLELASDSSVGDQVMAVGHPALMPLTLSGGEILGSQDIMTLEFITLNEKDLNCQKPKNSIVKIGERIAFKGKDLTIESIYACVNVTKSAKITNLLIRPGSSGSPMVNWKGQVEGVMFAGDPFGWGAAVSLQDVKSMLKMY
jgi:Trypsin-like peptidase domain